MFLRLSSCFGVPVRSCYTDVYATEHSFGEWSSNRFTDHSRAVLWHILEAAKGWTVCRQLSLCPSEAVLLKANLQWGASERAADRRGELGRPWRQTEPNRRNDEVWEAQMNANLLRGVHVPGCCQRSRILFKNVICITLSLMRFTGSQSICDSSSFQSLQCVHLYILYMGCLSVIMDAVMLLNSTVVPVSL